MSETPPYVRLLVKERDLPVCDFPRNQLGWYVISYRMMDCLQDLIADEIQKFEAPIRITESGNRLEGFAVLQVATQLDCIVWDLSDPLSPCFDDDEDDEFKDTYISFNKLTVSTKEIGGCHLFMAKGFTGTAICSERFVDCVERNNGTGFFFTN